MLSHVTCQTYCMRIDLSDIQQLLSFLFKVKSIWQIHILINYNLEYAVTKSQRICQMWPLPESYQQQACHSTNTRATNLGSVYQRYHMLWEGGLKITEMRANGLQSVSHISTGPQQGVMNEHQSCPASNWWGLSEKGSVYSPFYGEAKSRWRIQGTVSHLL